MIVISIQLFVYEAVNAATLDVISQNFTLDEKDTYKIMWKVLFYESYMNILDRDLSYLLRSPLQRWS